MQPFETVTWPLVGWRTVALEAQATIDGVDLTGATFRAEFRDRAEGGALRAALDTVSTSAAEGVRLMGVEMVDGFPVSTIAIRINETTLESIPAATTLGAEPGDDLTLRWGMHITPSGGLKFMAFDGPVTIKAGVPAA